MPATTEKEKAKKTKAEEKLADMERKVREAEAVRGKSYAELREAAMAPGGAKTAIREQRQTDREERRWQHTLRQAERTQGASMGDIRTLGRRLSSRDQMVLAAEAQRKKEEAASLAAKALPENVDIIKKVMTGEQEVPEE